MNKSHRHKFHVPRDAYPRAHKFHFIPDTMYLRGLTLFGECILTRLCVIVRCIYRQEHYIPGGALDEWNILPPSVDEFETLPSLLMKSLC